MRAEDVSMRGFLLFLASLGMACEEAAPAARPDAQTGGDDAGVELDAARDSAPPDAQSSQRDGALDSSLDANVADGSRSDGSPDASAADASLTNDAAQAACNVTAPTACSTPAPRYGDVMPIFAARCTICHGQMEGGPWPLDNYEDIAHWADDVRATVVSCAMPPPDAGVPITDGERRLVLDWLRCGLPR
jgi:hypothetical protein